MEPQGISTVVAVALLLGARHATEPDHLTAVVTLALDRAGDRARRIAWLGLLWGLGHGTTVLLLGAPVVLVGALLPPGLQRAAECLVGVLIALLAVRLLVRWHRGSLHLHPHPHVETRRAETWHAHPHVHLRAPEKAHPSADRHRHADGFTAPGSSLVLGLVHGVGGSSAAAVLLVAVQPTMATAMAALLVFAAAAALAMSLLSGLLGILLARRPLAVRIERAIPVLGTASLAFGLVYAVSAWS